MTDKRFLSVKEAAEELCVSASTVRNLIKAGKLRAAKLGNSLRIPTADLENFIAEALEAGAQLPDDDQNGDDQSSDN